MNAIYRDALRNIFPSVTVPLAIMAGLLVMMLIPRIPWWLVVPGVLVVLVLGVMVMGKLAIEAQALADERREALATFVPLEPINRAELAELNDEEPAPIRGRGRR